MDGNSQSNQTKSVNDLFQVILSNGFPRLRICTTTGIGSLDLNKAWTGSLALRLLILNVQTAADYEQVRSLCPNLRQFKSASYLQIDLPKGMILFPLSRKVIFDSHVNKYFRHIRL